MKNYSKKDFPVSEIRRFLEPGPVILVSSSHKGKNNIMTMGWHMVMEFEPSLVGCYVWDQDDSHNMIRKSKECVINIPTVDIATKVVQIGNCHGSDVDKFKEFQLTPVKGKKVKAPLIKECFANFECKLVDLKLKYNLFIFEVVKAHVAKQPKFPKTIHYRGDGLFMISGETTSCYRKLFKKENL